MPANPKHHHPVGFVATLIVLALLASPALAEPIEPERVVVVDSDTIDLDGKRFRLVGFNPPEPDSRHAKCAAEIPLGLAATIRLQELVDAGALSFEKVTCSCRPGNPWHQALQPKTRLRASLPSWHRRERLAYLGEFSRAV